MKWLDKRTDVICSKRVANDLKKKTGFVVKCFYLYTELERRNDSMKVDFLTFLGGIKKGHGSKTEFAGF